jgi:hypothetical protein
MRRLFATLMFGLIALVALRPEGPAAAAALPPACESAAMLDAVPASYVDPAARPAPRQSTIPGQTQTACNLACARNCQAAAAACRAPPAVCQQQRAACLRACGC